MVWGRRRTRRSSAPSRPASGCRRPAPTGPPSTDDMKEVFAVDVLHAAATRLRRRPPPQSARRLAKNAQQMFADAGYTHLLGAALYLRPAPARSSRGRVRSDPCADAQSAANRSNHACKLDSSVAYGPQGRPGTLGEVWPNLATGTPSMPAERRNGRAGHRDRRRDHRRRAGRPVCGVRARPRRHQGARHRHPRQARRPMRRALSRKSRSTTFPGLPIVTGQELTDRLLAQIKPFGATFHLGQRVDALRAHRTTAASGSSPTPATQFLAKVVVIAAGGGSFTPKRPPLAGHRGLRGQVRVLFRAAHGGLPRQGRADRRRRRLRARLDAQPAARRQARSPCCTGATSSAAPRTRSRRCARSWPRRRWTCASAR